MVVGHPMDEKAKLGAVVPKEHMESTFLCKISTRGRWYNFNRRERILLEGEHAEGYYLEPTIIEGLDYDCRTNQEEIFGPWS